MEDWKTILSIVSVAIAVAAFFIGRQTASKTDGERQGEISADIRYIKESVQRIETTTASESARVNGRVDEISLQLATIASTASAARESATMEHKRLNEHLEREHGIKIERRKED